MQERTYKAPSFKGDFLMGKGISIGHILAWPFLLPGNIACDALGFGERENLVRMLLNSLIWTVFGVVAVALVV